MIPGLGRFPWRREQLSIPVFWPGEFHGQRSLAGYNPWGCKESDTTKRFSLYCVPQTVIVLLFNYTLKTNKLMKKEIEFVVTRGEGRGRGNSIKVVKRYKLPVMII